jgi:hypothetical protein
MTENDSFSLMPQRSRLCMHARMHAATHIALQYS